MFLHQLTTLYYFGMSEQSFLSVFCSPFFSLCSVFSHGFCHFLFVFLWHTSNENRLISFFCNSNAVSVSSFRSFRMRVICQMNYKSCWLCTHVLGKYKTINHSLCAIVKKTATAKFPGSLWHYFDTHSHCCIWDNWTGETQITAIAAAWEKV